MPATLHGQRALILKHFGAMCQQAFLMKAVAENWMAELLDQALAEQAARRGA
jgi:hypothetical protein